MKTFIRYSLQCIGLLTILTVLAGFGLATFAGYWMNVKDKPAKADYIIPLAGDAHRIMRATELYREGYAPTILFSNAVAIPPSRFDKLKWKMGFPQYTRVQFRRLMLQQLGAASAHVEAFGNGHVSTVEEAEALRVYLGGQPKHLLIVTSPYHAKRAKMIFEKALPNCTISISMPKEGTFQKWWWKDQQSAQLLVMEFAKTIHYLLGGVYRSSDRQESHS